MHHVLMAKHGPPTSAQMVAEAAQYQLRFKHDSWWSWRYSEVEASQTAFSAEVEEAGTYRAQGEQHATGPPP